MRRATQILCLLLAAFSISMVILRPVPWDSVAGGLLIIWISAVPAVLYLQGSNLAQVPFLPAVGAYYAVFYGLPVFLAPLAYRQGANVVVYLRYVLAPLSWDVILLVGGGIAVMFAAFYACRLTIFAKLPSLRLPVRHPRDDVLNICYWLLLIASLVFRLTSSLESIPSIGQFFDPVGYLSLGGLYLQWQAGRLPRWQTMLALVCVPIDLYERARFLFVTDVLFLAMFFAFVLWRSNRIWTLGAIVATGSILALSYSATTAYRAQGQSFLAKVNASAVGMMEVLTNKVTAQGRIGDNHQIVAPGLNGIGQISFDPRISPLVNRIGHIWLFQTVVDRTPNPIPYWNGHTYRPLLTSMIPRVLYPDKPKEVAGGEFGVRYGFTEAEVNDTSFNIPWIVELFANFGSFGVFAGMGVLGVMLAALDKILNSSDATDLEFLIGLTIMFRLSYQESNLSVMIGSMPLLILSIYVYFSLGPKLLTVLIDRLGPRLPR